MRFFQWFVIFMMLLVAGCGKKPTVSTEGTEAGEGTTATDRENDGVGKARGVKPQDRGNDKVTEERHLHAKDGKDEEIEVPIPRLPSAKLILNNSLGNNHRYGVYSVAFSPDGKTLAAGGHDKTISLWQTGTGEPLDTLKGGNDRIKSVTFAGTGKTLASAGGVFVTLWDMTTRKPAKRMDTAGPGIYSMAFGSDGKRIACGCALSTVVILDVEAGTLQRRLDYSDGKQALAVAFSQDGTRLVAGYSGNQIIVWDTSSGEKVLTLMGHKSGVRSVAFSPDGKVMASASGDRTVKLWAFPSGDILSTLEHDSPVQTVAFSRDGRTLASGSGRTITLWNVQEKKAIVSETAYNEAVTSLAFGPDGKTLASGGFDRNHPVKIWSIVAPEVQFTREHGKELITIKNGRSVIRGYKKSESKMVLHGEQVTWIEDGTTKRVQYTTNRGRKSGPYSEWDKDDKVIVRGAFVGGLKEGEWSFYDGRGVKVESQTFKAGKPHGKWISGTSDTDYYSERAFKEGRLDGTVIKKAKVILGPGRPQVLPKQELLYTFEFVDGKPKYDRKKGTKADFYNMLDVIAVQGAFDSKIGYFGVFDEQQFFDIFGQPDRKVPLKDGFGNLMLTFRCSDGVVTFGKVSIAAGKVATMYP